MNTNLALVLMHSSYWHCDPWLHCSKASTLSALPPILVQQPASPELLVALVECAHRVESNALMQWHMSLQVTHWLIAWATPPAVDATNKGLHCFMKLSKLLASAAGSIGYLHTHVEVGTV